MPFAPTIGIQDAGKNSQSNHVEAEEAIQPSVPPVSQDEELG